MKTSIQVDKAKLKLIAVSGFFLNNRTLDMNDNVTLLLQLLLLLLLLL